MKNLLFCFALLLIATDASGQNLRFSREVEQSKDKTLCAVKNLWESYFSAASKNSDTKEYWIDNDEDVVKYGFSPSSPMYAFANHTTFNINRVDSVTFQINTISELDSTTPKDVLFVYTLYARETSTGLKLMSTLAYKMEDNSIRSKTYGHIKYHYPKGYEFSEKKADETSIFANDFREKMQISQPVEINYVVANNLDEANLMIGFRYTIGSSGNKYAGISIYPNYILSQRENHIHEVVHAIMIRHYPEAGSLLHEGVATYFGGASGKDFNQLVIMLDEYLSENPATDEIESLNFMMADGFNPFYVVGALIIESAIKVDGYSGLINLFKSPDDISESHKGDLSNYISKLIDSHKKY